MDNGFMVCRALRPSTETWISVKIPPETLTATPEEGVQWVLEEFNCQFIPMKFEWKTGEESEE
jgi:hypothetical protein